MKIILKIWNKLFLEERPSISMGFFRVAIASTVILVVVPAFFHMGDNFYPTAFKTYNLNFFPLEFVELVQTSPIWLINSFVALFCIVSFFFLIGFLSQLSCILTMLCCYYFYALNPYPIHTLSWDMLLVVLFLTCLTPYIGDYFSLDCLLWGKKDAYKRLRPFFMQRLLQLYIGFVFFYTALYKIYPNGNWIKENPIYYIMNYPPAGTTKWFLLRDYLKTQPELCYWIGISIIVVEALMIFLLFVKKTRISAIYLGIVFHIILMLTLDVPATFFFLFPPLLLLFINPNDIISWIESRRLGNQSSHQRVILYDGQCGICKTAIKRIKIMDLLLTCKYVDFHAISDFSAYHKKLTKEHCEREIVLVDSDGSLFGGFAAFRKMSFSMPMMYPFILIFYFPGMGIIGPFVYKLIARNRNLLKILPA